MHELGVNEALLCLGATHLECRGDQVIYPEL